MRWSIIRTIWLREMRDQLRDRRTLLVILGLPLILYPLLGFAVLQFAVGFTEKPSVIGVVSGSPDVKDFPRREPANAGRHVAPAAAWFAAALPGFDMPHAAGVCALTHASRAYLDYPLLIEDGHFTVFDAKVPRKTAREWAAQARFDIEFLSNADPALLSDRKVDLILEVPDDFFVKLTDAEAVGNPPRPAIQVHVRRDDDRSRLALRRLTPLLDAWKHELKKVRLARRGFTEEFLDPFEVRQPAESSVVAGRRALSGRRSVCR
ncbi:MAG: hypothetical protein HY289_13560 [Planctomycetes bacterium]|nr:hypothetical protein [Planctomycetota bacterium]